jgi:hypothetical protein
VRDAAIDPTAERLEPVLEPEIRHGQHAVGVEIRDLVRALQVV